MEKSKKHMRIGVLDSGIGGLTVVRELERLAPRESVLYIGDNANCPYGNRTQEEILGLTLPMLDFFQEQGVKAVAIACNTISSLIDRYRDRYEFPIISIIETACEYVAGQGLAQVGVFATEFTIREGLYETLIRRLNPQAGVYGAASRSLAGIIDKGRFDDPAIAFEIRRLLDTLQQAHPEVEHIVLGCTHYPIVQDMFRREAPDVTFIDPAREQAKAVCALLKEQGLFTDASKARHDIFTSGDEPLYMAALEKLDIQSPVTVHII